MTITRGKRTFKSMATYRASVAGSSKGGKAPKQGFAHGKVDPVAAGKIGGTRSKRTSKKTS